MNGSCLNHINNYMPLEDGGAFVHALLKCQTTNFSPSLCKFLISQHHFLLDLFSLNVPPSPPTLTLIKLTNSSSLFTKKVETPKFAELPK